MVIFPWKIVIFHSYIDGNGMYIYIYMYMILVGGWPTPLKNIGQLSQLGWQNSQYEGTNKTCSKPPTRKQSPHDLEENIVII